jgi:hypothetical protein
LPAQMPVGQLKIWPINIKWHLQLLTNIETYSRPRFTYMQHLSEILVSGCQSNWFRPRQGQQVAETLGSLREMTAHFFDSFTIKQTRDFLSSISRVFFSFFRGRRTWTYASVNDCWTQHQ